MMRLINPEHDRKNLIIPIRNVKLLKPKPVSFFLLALILGVSDGLSSEVLSVKDDLFILSGMCIDPSIPISSKLEEALDPVVVSHTDQG